MKKKFRIGLVTRREMKGYIFILPWLLGFLFFFATPLIQSFIYSLNNIKLTANGRKMSFVGLDNYAYIFNTDTVFTPMLSDFYVNAALRLAVILVFALIIAMMLNQKIRCKGVFRTLFFLPIVVVSGPVLSRLLDEGATTVPLIESYGVNGMITELLPGFIAEPLGALFSEIILVLWYSGVPILIYMTGLQKIDRSLYEAALIDGASQWVVFWKITLPALRPMILINGVYTLVFLATSGLNDIIALISDRMFSTSTGGGYGVASAISWIYTLTLALALLVIMLITKERKPKHIEIVKTRQQIEVERMHAERAAHRKGVKHGKKAKVRG